MTQAPTCPRCRGRLHPPGLWSSEWRCDSHGDVDPFHAVHQLGETSLQHVAEMSKVPVWMPWPLPLGWLVTGVAHAGDERTGARGSVVALSGPCPLGGPAELLLVAESAGVGLGASYAGLDTSDPAPSLDGTPEVKLQAAGHPTGLWAAPSAPDRAALVGEAYGVWLWAIIWPPSAGITLLDSLQLHDLRENEAPITMGLPFGAPSPRL